MSKVIKKVSVDMSNVENKLEELIEIINNAFDNDIVEDELITLEEVNTVDGKSYTFIKGDYSKHYSVAYGYGSKGNKSCVLYKREERVRFNHSHVVSIVESDYKKEFVRFQ